MKTVLTLAVGAVVGALIAVVVLLALDDDDEARAGALTPDPMTPADCLQLIPDPVFETLGWQLGSTATEHASRCERHGEDGSVTLGDLAVVAAGGEARVEAVERVYDERCSEVFGGGSTPDVAIDWLPDGTTACAVLLPPGQDRGLAELILQTEDDEVVEIRLVALSGTPEDSVEAAFGQLVAAAEARF